jgi:hypothetical protein
VSKQINKSDEVGVGENHSGGSFRGLKENRALEIKPQETLVRLPQDSALTLCCTHASLPASPMFPFYFSKRESLSGVP